MRTRSWVCAAVSIWGVVACGCDDSGLGVPDSGIPDLTPAATPAPFGLDSRPTNPGCLAPPRPLGSTTVALSDPFPNLTFSLPTALRQAPGDATHFYLVQKGGTVQRFDNDPAAATKTEFINITTKVNSSPNEAGLLGIAFHPQFATNKQVFLSYTAFSASSAANLRSTVSRFTVQANGLGDPTTEQLVLPPNDTGTVATPNVLDQPFVNHNGGNILFGPDGFLYAGFGDGGSGGDPGNRSQDTALFFGKMLRLDVDTVPAGQRYGIPPTNPFKNGGGAPEIFAYGLRNPWRWSFDRATGELWVGDVGQDLWEEVDLVKVGGNYGWHIREGMHCYPPGATCTQGALIDPIVEYNHTGGASRSITGGYVYRGSAIPSLVGTYIYGDEVNGDLYAIVYDAMGQAQQTLLLNTGFNISSFAEDADGELYLLEYVAGKIHKLVPAGTPPPNTFPQTLSATGCVDPNDATKPAAGLIPYDVNVPLWSDGADKQRWMALPDSGQIHINADGDWDFPIGTVLMKQFSLGGKPIETRLFMHHPDGNWAGYSYEWNDAGTDADLLPAGKAKPVGAQTWTYPSRSDCLECHTAIAGRSLGLETAQLNRDLVYVSTLRISNQLATLDHIGMFDAPLPAPPAMLGAYPAPDAIAAPIDQRARAYLQANCSFCHRPQGTGQGPADLRFATPFNMTNTCNQTPQEGDLGITGAKLIVPGMPDQSLISVRMRALDAKRMPPIATKIVDATGTQLINDFISSLTACP